MATLLDPTDQEVRAAIDAGREVLVGLGARPLIEQLDAAMARPADVAGDRPAPAGPGSTARRPGSAIPTV
jgi:hypothetical protein